MTAPYIPACHCPEEGPHLPACPHFDAAHDPPSLRGQLLDAWRQKKRAGLPAPLDAEIVEVPRYSIVTFTSRRSG